MLRKIISLLDTLLSIIIHFSLVLGLFAGQPARASRVQPELPQKRSYDEIDAYIGKQLEVLDIPGAVLAIVEGNRIVHIKGFGLTRPGGAVPTSDTPFILGSLTKSFTALAIMQLVEAGKIGLDDPIQLYLPWFRVADPTASGHITVRHLLTHTSGLSKQVGMQAIANLDDLPRAGERQARSLANTKLTHQPGLVFEYSNMNYNLLGLIIEAASGEPYVDYVHEHIFISLEMRHSYRSKAVAQQNGLAVGYRSWFGIPVADPDLPVPSGSLPSGGLISSTEDLSHYLIAYLNGGQYGGVQVLSPEGIAQLTKPAVETGISVPGVDYGMGWVIQETSRGRRIWHNGKVPDYFSYMALLPEQNSGIVLLGNVNHTASMYDISMVGAGAASLLAGLQPEPIPWAMVPWATRSFLVIPVIQIAGVFTLIKLRKHWKLKAGHRPGGIRALNVFALLLVILNLGVAILALALLTSRILPFLFLFIPDLTWLALVCGSFALAWLLLCAWFSLKVNRSH